MASQTQDSLRTVSSQQLQEARRKLLYDEGQPYEVRSQPEARSEQQHTPQQRRRGNSESNDDAPSSLPATIQESADAYAYISPVASPTRVPRLSVSKSAPGDVQTMAQSSPSQNTFKKALSFGGMTHAGGDTQPMPSQLYHDERVSMILLRQSMHETTPSKAMAILNTSPQTANSTWSALSRSERTVQEGESGYVDLEGAYRQSSPVGLTQGSQGFDELLEDQSSPRTQFRAPGKTNTPETPALAGQKRTHDGELLTSALTTKTKTPWDSQAFGEKPSLLTNTQLFAQTQARSSPVPDAPRSDPILSRPSPNFKGLCTLSSPVPSNSSPILTRNGGTSWLPGEPRPYYRIMAEESEDLREETRAVSEQARQAERSSDIDDDGFDDSQDRRHVKRRIRRTLSDQARRNAQIKAPARPDSRPSSSRKSNVTIDLMTPGAPHAQSEELFSNLDLEEEPVLVEEVGLPRLPIHEDDYDGQDEPDEEADRKSQTGADEGDDEYDELGQALRSQANDLDVDDNVSHIGSVDLRDDELEDDEQQGIFTANVHDGIDGKVNRTTAQGTQGSTIADSQPMPGQIYNQKLSGHLFQHSSMASFVPGSQYAGKTSEDQALLQSSQRRVQSRIPTSQPYGGPGGGTEKIPSSPPLPIAESTISGDHIGASLAQQELVEQFGSRRLDQSVVLQEIPESDIPETEPQEPGVDLYETAHEDEETQETNTMAPFSTARTQVSASARSPAKSSVAPSPIKAFNSQQSRVTDFSPRKAAGVRRFAEMTTDLTSSNNSFEISTVDEIMNFVNTDEDRRVVEVATDPIELPKAKRRKFTRNLSSQLAHSNAKVVRQKALEEVEVEADVQQNTVGNANAIIPESEQDLEPQRSLSVLKDAQSKGNELPTPMPSDKVKPQEDSPNSVQRREKEGSDFVSQLVATRSTAFAKKSKQATYSRASKKKSGGKSISATAKKATKSKKIDAAQEREVGMDDNSIEPKMTESIDRPVEDATDHMAEECLPDAVISDQAAITEALTEPPDDTVGDQQVVASQRILALFKGSFNNFYPATWLGGSADGLTYRVQFDDNTVTNIETYHVRSLDLRIGDLVKVDMAGMRSKTWRITSFGPVAQNSEQRALGVDIRGHFSVKVQAKTMRNSMSKDALAATLQGESEVKEVFVYQIYLTTTMWPSYQERTFSPSSNVKSGYDRPETPSTRPGTPSIETPVSRSLRAVMPAANGKALGPRVSHLRETSVASSTSSGQTAIFSRMAFAISYVAKDAEKTEVARLIQRNGGVVLDNGFEELFALPNVGESAPTALKKSPTKKNPEGDVGLQLKAEHANLAFVALIADRHSRRAKYMQALALGLPTLSGRWIIDSLDASKNTTLRGGEVAPVAWDRYLLPAGESSYLGGAIRSRTLALGDTELSELKTTISARPVLLNGESVVIVAPKKGKSSWDKRKTYAFLTLALGAGQVKRVNDLQEAKDLMQDDSNGSKLVYVDGSVADAEAALFGKTAAGKKRKRDGEIAGVELNKMSVTRGNVRIVNDEFVVQSLILGALAE